jgi:hypothetical protein
MRKESDMEKKDLKIVLKEVGFRTVVLFDDEWYAEFEKWSDAVMFVENKVMELKKEFEDYLDVTIIHEKHKKEF